ncbi:Ig-like domain-containing protein [Brachybacterium phenoliresistens]|uniref:Ig-like domain-containing protein n=1 Tax=Brachybacterium phenoliresistens TaxID=396014 RepID=UPI0031DFFB68
MPYAPRETPRSGGRRRTRAAAATFAAGLALGPMMIAAPAAALGEDGPFELPLTTSEITVAPATETRVDIAAFVEDSAEPELDLGSTRLEIPQDAPADARERMTLSEDGRRLEIAGEGTWSIQGTQIVYLPAPGSPGAATPVALTIGSVHETRSEPAELTVAAPDSVVQRVRASAGQSVTVHLLEQDPQLVAGQQELLLEGLPNGSTVTSDGTRLVVPQQGSWQLSEDRLSLTFTPVRSKLGSQPTPVRYASYDESGQPARAGTVTVMTPVIPDTYRSAPFGDPIVFNLAEGMQNVSASTLELALPTDEPGAIELSEDRTEAVVPDQGVWRLDRSAGTVTFTPDSREVTVAAPMGVIGGDGEGATSSRALLDPGYPVMADLTAAGVHGSPVVFDLADQPGRDVRADAITFTVPIPEGATLAADARSLRVPGEGTWAYDVDAKTVTFTPATAEPGLVVTPVTIESPSVYSDNATTSTLTVQYASSVPTIRADDARTPPGTPVTADVLANDTPGAVGQPLDPASLRLRSLDAVNLEELENWTGSRLEIPDEGVFTIGNDGVLSFQPAAGFVGTTPRIDYLVTDSAGVVSRGTFAVEVDPEAESGAATPQDTAGINTVLAGLLPGAASTAVVFGAVVGLTLFAGGTMLWIGTRMEIDRRTWKD